MMPLVPCRAHVRRSVQLCLCPGGISAWTRQSVWRSNFSLGASSSLDFTAAAWRWAQLRSLQLGLGRALRPLGINEHITKLMAYSFSTERGGRRPARRAAASNRLGSVVGHNMQRSKNPQQVIIQR